MANRNDSNGLFFRSLPAAVLCLCAALFARADVPLITTGDYVVDPVNGVDSTAGGNTTFKTIQFAIDSLTANWKTILIKTGHYRLTEPITNSTKRAFTLIGENPNNPRAVLIDGQGMTPCIVNDKNTSTLANLCVTNGLQTGAGTFLLQNTYICGGGIVLQGVNSTITNCVVTDCHIKTTTVPLAYGGGIYIRNSGAQVLDTLVEYCTITAEVATASGYSYLGGGGIYACQGQLKGVTVRNCGVYSHPDDANWRRYGGGAYTSGSSSAPLRTTMR